MFKIKSVLEQVIDERKNNTVLNGKIEKLLSDIDYVAMMCDIELEEEENE
ncbi:MAG: hypothetical protein IJ279_05900 [Clostridia bacterium]|nr:hypothetical protein [Clostridia bacterium]